MFFQTSGDPSGNIAWNVTENTLYTYYCNIFSGSEYNSCSVWCDMKWLRLQKGTSYIYTRVAPRNISVFRGDTIGCKWVWWQVTLCHNGDRDMLGNPVTFYIQLIKKKLHSVLHSLVRHGNSGFYTWIVRFHLLQPFSHLLTLQFPGWGNILRLPLFPPWKHKGRDHEIKHDGFMKIQISSIQTEILHSASDNSSIFLGSQTSTVCAVR